MSSVILSSLRPQYCSVFILSLVMSPVFFLRGPRPLTWETKFLYSAEQPGVLSAKETLFDWRAFVTPSLLCFLTSKQEKNPVRTIVDRTWASVCREECCFHQEDQERNRLSKSCTKGHNLIILSGTLSLFSLHGLVSWGKGSEMEISPCSLLDHLVLNHAQNGRLTVSKPI